MDKEKVLGFVTELGSKTSHTAILAKMLEIPAVVGLGYDGMHGGETVIVDGTTGEVIVGPSQAENTLYTKRKEQFRENQARRKTLRDLPAITTDSHHVELCINIADPRETAKVAEVGGDGVGLFRTEFLAGRFYSKILLRIDGADEAECAGSLDQFFTQYIINL